MPYGRTRPFEVADSRDFEDAVVHEVEPEDTEDLDIAVVDISPKFIARVAQETTESLASIVASWATSSELAFLNKLMTKAGR